jgi:uncharacterized C2H2 Zn-finger protein
MARELIALIRCDRCGNEIDVGDPASLKPMTITMDNRTADVDLCADCDDKVQAGLAFVKWRKAKRNGQPTARTVVVGEFPCTYARCDRTFDTQQGLSMHITRTHKKKGGRK